MKKRSRKTKSLILALAVAAVVTPVAQARLDSERSQVTQSPASRYSPQAYNALMQRSVALNQQYGQAAAIHALMVRSQAMNMWYRQHSSTPVIPDVFSRELTKAQSVSTTIRHADDRAGIRGPGIVETPQVVSASGSGFDWADASLGAGTALAVALILMGGLVLVRRNQTGHHVAA